jgi:hypothetical protein
MRKFSLLILLIAFTFSCKNNAEQAKAIEYLENVALSTNKSQKLPRKVDEVTIAEKVVFDNNKFIMTYSYKLLIEDYDKTELINTLKEIELEQIQRAKENQGNDKAYKLLNVIINNVYKDSNEKEIYSFQIKPEQYLK